ncbi:MAG: type II toxin-antitoxin system VapC family toxin [Pirellulales bacterium]
MSDLVVDSSDVAKWILPEADSAKAQHLIVQTAAAGERLIVLDLVFPEVANAIWKRHRQQLINLSEARALLAALVRSPVAVEPAVSLLASAFEMATKYDRAIYDALFVALAEQQGLPGITADEPLFNAIHADFPRIVLLRDFP